MATKSKQLLSIKRKRLVEYIELSDEFYAVLSFSKTLSKQEVAKIKENDTNVKKCECLVDLLISKGEQVMRSFRECLEATEQHQVLAILDDDSDDGALLSDEKRLQLVEKLQLNPAVFAVLKMASVLSKEEVINIKSKVSKEEQIQSFLDILLSKDESVMESFRECMEETEQHEVLEILDNYPDEGQECDEIKEEVLMRKKADDSETATQADSGMSEVNIEAKHSKALQEVELGQLDQDESSGDGSGTRVKSQESQILSELIEEIEISPGFLAALRMASVLTEQEVTEVKKGANQLQQGYTLIDIIQKKVKDDKTVGSFIECLEETEQNQVLDTLGQISDPEKEEETNKKATDQGSADQESTNQESVDQESTNQESADQESTNQESADQELTNQELTNQELTDKEANDQEPIDKKAVDDEFGSMPTKSASPDKVLKQGTKDSPFVRNQVAKRESLQMLLKGGRVAKLANQMHSKGFKGDKYKPRLCHLKKWPNLQGYGFYLHVAKSKPGGFIRQVDRGSSAEASGLRTGYKIIEVNNQDIAGRTHQELIDIIKENPKEVKLLVMDAKTLAFYQEKCRTVTSSSPEVVAIPCPLVPNKKYAKVKHNFTPEGDRQDTHTQVALVAGDIVEVLQQLPSGWTEGVSKGRRGHFPTSYVEIINME